MEFDEYQKVARTTAIYPRTSSETSLIYVTLGLAGEAGEIAEKMKKVIRDHGGKIDAETTSLLKDEIGDLIWYASQFALELGLSFDDIAQRNLEKLASRRERGIISGSGDRR